MFKTLLITPFSILLLSGCATSSSDSNSRFGIEDFGEDFTCEQVISEIAQFNQNLGRPPQSGRETLAIASSSMAAAVALAAQPYLVISGIIHHFGKRNKTLKQNALLNHIVTLARNKDCKTPEFNLENTPHIRMATETSNKSSLVVPPMELLPIPRYCYLPQDSTERVYQVGLKNFDPEEYLRFFSKGTSMKSVKIKVSHIMYAKAALPKMRMSGHLSGSKEGLWVERLSNGERTQLSSTSGKKGCDISNAVTTDYLNLWVVAKEVSE